MIVILSPHSDDAVLSLGAWIAAKTDAGTSVRVITVFGNDRTGDSELSDWDRRAGFTTSSEAARARYREDCAALRILGAEPVHLSFPDSSYVRGERDPDAVFEALAPNLDGASVVLSPGFPLVHRDHRWLTQVMVGRLGEVQKLAFYVEQPYAWWNRATTLHGLHVASTTARPSHIRRKLLALRRYESQLPLLGGWRVLPRALLVDLVGGGEKLRTLPELGGILQPAPLERAELLALAAA